MIYVSLATFKGIVRLDNSPNIIEVLFLPVFLFSFSFSEVHTQAQIVKHVRQLTKGHSTKSSHCVTLLACSSVTVWISWSNDSRELMDFFDLEKKIAFEYQMS